MSRNPNEEAQRQDLVPVPPEHLHAAQIAASAVMGQAVGWMNLAEVAGSIKTAGFFATVADRLLLDAYVKVKESKAYAGMPYRTADGSIATVASLDEYCRAFLGKSYRRCEDLLSNRKLVGEDLYEQAESIGFRQRDYNALRALPAEDREVINRALEAGADRETVIEQLVTLTERQIAQKAKLTEELADAHGTIEAKDRRYGEREQEVESLSAQLRKAKNEAKRATPEQVAATLREKCLCAAYQCRADISNQGDDEDSLYNRFTQLRAHAGDQGNLTAHDAYLGGLIGEVLAELRGLRDQIGLPIVGDYGDPNWSTGG